MKIFGYKCMFLKRWNKGFRFREVYLIYFFILKTIKNLYILSNVCSIYIKII